MLQQHHASDRRHLRRFAVAELDQLGEWLFCCFLVRLFLAFDGPAKALFCSPFFRDSERFSRSGGGAVFLRILRGKKDDCIDSKSKDKRKRMEDGR
jgi:hypothetical protein